MDWGENLREETKRQGLQAKAFSDRYKIDFERVSINSTKEWIFVVNKLIKEGSTYKKGDIRKYMMVFRKKR